MKHLTEKYQNWIHRIGDHIRIKNHDYIRQLLREFFGTMAIVMYGVGVAAQAKLTETFGQMLDLSLGYAGALALGMFITGKESKGLLNPAIAFAQCIVGRLEFLHMLGYWLVEILGAYIGNLLVVAIYHEKLMQYPNGTGTLAFDMEGTGTIFTGSVNVSSSDLVVDQFIVGMIAMVGIMAALDKNNMDLPGHLQFAYIAMIKFLMLNDYSLNTSSNNNPAMDFGGRLALLSTGWGTEAFSYGNYAFVIFLFVPFLAAIGGVLIYELLIGIHLPGAGGSGEADEEAESYTDVEIEKDLRN